MRARSANCSPRQAGKFVAVSAGDNLETVMAAHGSGAVARSIRDKATVMNVDVGGGTSKIAVCADGKVVDLTALDVGARLVCVDDERPHRAHRGSRAALRRRARHRRSRSAARSSPERRAALAARMADRLFEAMRGGAPSVGGAGLCRLDPLSPSRPDRRGHVLGRRVGIHLRPRGRTLRRPRRAAGAGNPHARRRLGSDDRALERGHPRHRGRRLAVHHAGQRQHDLRVADGGAAAAQRAGDRADAAARRRGRSTAPRSSAAIKGVLRRLDLGEGDTPVAVFVPWRGSATFAAAGRASATAPSTGSPICWRAATRSCSPATATSAA